jgi:hypothetical protein
MKFRLYGPKYVAGKYVETFPSYRAAVLAGQERFGRGKFHVESPEDYIPSRDEQLLKTLSNRERRTDHETLEQVEARRDVAKVRARLLKEGKF